MTINSGWVRYRGATEAEWQALNPIVPRRAFAVSEDVLRVKIGDGVTRWANLSYLLGFPSGEPGSGGGSGGSGNEPVPAPTLTVTPSTLDDATVDDAYSQTFNVSGGTAPYEMSVVSGSLPTGLTLDDLTISGTPTVEGSFSFTLAVTDAAAVSSGNRPYSILVIAESGEDPTHSDNFNDNSIDTGFWATTGTVAETGQRMRTTGNPGQVETTFARDLTFFFAAAQVYPDTAAAGRTILRLGNAGDVTTLSMIQDVDADVLACNVLFSGVEQYEDYFPISTAGDWWRIGYDGTNVLFQISDDGVTWDTLSSTAVDASRLTALKGRLRHTGSANYCEWDNFSFEATTLEITTASLDAGVVGSAYADTIVAAGGTPPYTWSLAGGTLPAGLTLQSDGDLVGTPTTPGLYPFSAKVIDFTGKAKTKAFTVTVAAAPTTGTGDYAGPTVADHIIMWSDTLKLQTAESDVPWAAPYTHASQKYHSWGVDAWVENSGHLSGVPDGAEGTWELYPPTTPNYNTRLLGNNGQWGVAADTVGIGDGYAGIYVPHKELALPTADNADWTDTCTKLQNWCRWAGDHGYKGIGLDWERWMDHLGDMHGPLWAHDWRLSGLTESAARAKAVERGAQMMAALDAGWDASSAASGLRVLNYSCDFFGSWRSWQGVHYGAGGDWSQVHDEGVLIDFWEGASSVSGTWSTSGCVLFLAAAFYKRPDGGQGDGYTKAGWDNALASDKSFHRQLFEARFDHPDRFGWVPFGWIGAAAGSDDYNAVQPLSRARLQFQAFADVEPDGAKGADYRYDEMRYFNPTPWAEVYGYEPA